VVDVDGGPSGLRAFDHSGNPLPEVALPAILPHLHGGSAVHALPFALNALALVAAGLLLGAAGSGVTLRRFLQV